MSTSKRSKPAAAQAVHDDFEAVAHAPVVLDIEGLTLNDDDRRRLAHPLTGGLILFARNWASRSQLTALCAEIKAIRPDVLICVDHEGGRVQRFKTDGFTHVPEMRSLGEMWMNDGKGGEGTGALRATDAATACGYVLASELRSCGVDLTFTPVLDLDWGESGVIGDRAFHGDPRVVTVLAKSVMHGLLLAGMANCGKHFPGHGFVKADSHVDVPVDKRSLKAILAEDAAPYPWLSSTLAHQVPASIEVRIGQQSVQQLERLLSERLGTRVAIRERADAGKIAEHLLDRCIIGQRVEGLGPIGRLAAGCTGHMLWHANRRASTSRHRLAFAPVPCKLARNGGF